VFRQLYRRMSHQQPNQTSLNLSDMVEEALRLRDNSVVVQNMAGNSNSQQHGAFTTLDSSVVTEPVTLPFDIEQVESSESSSEQIVTQPFTNQSEFLLKPVLTGSEGSWTTGNHHHPTINTSQTTQFLTSSKRAGKFRFITGKEYAVLNNLT
jgi:hypothetical protein